MKKSTCSLQKVSRGSEGQYLLLFHILSAVTTGYSSVVTAGLEARRRIKRKKEAQWEHSLLRELSVNTSANSIWKETTPPRNFQGRGVYGFGGGERDHPFLFADLAAFTNPLPVAGSSCTTEAPPLHEAGAGTVCVISCLSRTVSPVPSPSVSHAGGLFGSNPHWE